MVLLGPDEALVGETRWNMRIDYNSTLVFSCNVTPCNVFSSNNSLFFKNSQVLRHHIFCLFKHCHIPNKIFIYFLKFMYALFWPVQSDISCFFLVVALQTTVV